MLFQEIPTLPLVMDGITCTSIPHHSIHPSLMLPSVLLMPMILDMSTSEEMHSQKTTQHTDMKETMDNINPLDLQVQDAFI